MKIYTALKVYSLYGKIVTKQHTYDGVVRTILTKILEDLRHSIIIDYVRFLGHRRLL